MHASQSLWCQHVKRLFPERFNGVNVLDVGSYDINGNNRYLFENYGYVGIDVNNGNNVDVVCPIHLFSTDVKFDVVVCTNMLEHDLYWKLSIKKMIDLTKSDGLLMIQSFIGVEHGTIKHCAHDSLTSTLDDELWKNHYYSVLPQDISNNFDLYKEFKHFSLGIQPNKPNEDLIFWGIKR